MHHFKMTRIFFTVISTFILSNLFGQEYLGDERADIKKKLHELVDTSSYKISITDSITHIYSFHSTTDTTTYFDTISNVKTLFDGFEKIELEYFFGSMDNLCDSIVIKFYCGKCADKHIKEFLDNKDRKWKQLGTDIYISRKQTKTYTTTDKTTLEKIIKVGSPQMVIKRTPDRPICVTVDFSIPMMDKDKWKQLTKK